MRATIPVHSRTFQSNFEMTELNPDGTLDYDKIASDIAEKKPKMVYIQRSRGYSTRPTLTWREIKKLCEISKANSPEVLLCSITVTVNSLTRLNLCRWA